MFRRDSAFSMEVRDPDDPEDKSPIVDAFVVGDEMLIFKTNGIYRNLTADTIDPSRSNPDTRHSIEKLYSVGTSNPFVARTILQFNEMLALAVRDQNRRAEIIRHVWHAATLLLECEKAQHHIYSHALELLPKCNQIIEVHKTKVSIPALPKIPDLRTHVSDFLINGKKFLVATYKLLNLFYAMPIDGNNEAHFNKHREWICKKLSADHQIHKLIKSDESWIRLISECSNAVRHEEDGLRIQIENFSLKPGNKFSGPAWRFDLTKKKMGRQEEYTDLIYDMDVHMQNMLTFFEEILLLCVQDEIKTSNFLATYKNEEDQVRADRPIVYWVGRK